MTTCLFRAVYRTVSFVSAMAMVVAASVLGSCTGDRGHLLDVIPADSRSVAVVSVDRLTKDCGGRQFAEFATLASGADRSLVAVVSASNAKQYKAMIPSDISAYREALVDSGFTSVTDGDFEVYSRSGSDDIVVSRDGKSVWQTDQPRAAEFIATQVSGASRSPMSALNGIDQYITSTDGTIVGVFSQQAVGAGVPGNTAESWYCFTVSQSDNRLAVDFSLMEETGKPQVIKGIKTIDTDFLRYIPEAQGVFAAVGLTPDVDWDAAGRMASSMAGTSAGGYISALMPYLKSIDGTVAVAVMPRDPSNLRAWNDPSVWNLFLMVHMPQKKVDEALNTIHLLAKMAGAKIEKDGAGVSRITVDGISFYAGAVDGNIAIATYPLDGKAQNSLATVFSGKNGAMSALLPATVAFGQPDGDGFDMSLAIQLEESGGRILFSLPGCDIPPLQKLMDIGFRRIPGF